ncbi:inositol monophosphatase family protein [soil metagenome]
MRSDLEVALRAARVAADVVRDGFGFSSNVRMKGQVDPVTETDTRAEAAICEVLASERPDDGVLAEESGGDPWRAGRVWIVDPLDGTVNFVQGIPHVSVSVALWDMGEPRVGVVIDVIRSEEFAAEAGQGAWLDGEPVAVSTQQNLGDAVVVTGFPYDRNEHAAAYGAVVGAVLEHVRGLRRLGSAALDFAWVSCGRFDAYWEYSLGPWDAAAGLLLVSEAGGRVSDEKGGRYDLESSTIVVSNGRLHEPLQALVASNLPAHLL